LLIFLMRRSVFTARYELKLHEWFGLISFLNTRVRFQVSLCDICGRRSGAEECFSLSTSVFTCQYHPYRSSPTRSS
jgi:hypothetical protein